MKKCEQWVNPLEKMPPSCIWETRCVYWELQGAAVRRFHNPTNQKGYLPMRLGLTELLLIVIIALLALGNNC